MPTVYVDKSANFFSNMVKTNQYAVTEFAHEMNPGAPEGFPGIFFKLDFQPVTVLVTASRPTFLKFLTRLCGVVGGIISATGMVLQFYQFAITMIKNAEK